LQEKNTLLAQQQKKTFFPPLCLHLTTMADSQDKPIGAAPSLCRKQCGFWGACVRVFVQSRRETEKCGGWGVHACRWPRPIVCGRMICIVFDVTNTLETC
jgi:hypothetical protein